MVTFYIEKKKLNSLSISPQQDASNTGIETHIFILLERSTLNLWNKDTHALLIHTQLYILNQIKSAGKSLFILP